MCHHKETSVIASKTSVTASKTSVIASKAKQSNATIFQKRDVMKKGYIYIMTNKPNGTLYVGVTSDIIRRVYEHKNSLVDGFTKQYNLKNLVYFEIFDFIENAIEREKQLKGGSRAKKIMLVESMNPTWRDLYGEIL